MFYKYFFNLCNYSFVYFNRCFSDVRIPHYQHTYSNVVLIPSIADSSFDEELTRFFKSLEEYKNYYLLFFYTYVTSKTDLKRRGECYLSKGEFLTFHILKRKDGKALNNYCDIASLVRDSFHQKYHSYDEFDYDEFGIESWINFNEVLFVNVINLGSSLDFIHKFPFEIFIPGSGQEYSFTFDGTVEREIYADYSKPISLTNKDNRPIKLNPWVGLIYLSDGIRLVN